MTHCEFDNEACYQVRSVPVIYDVSESTTYITGGQNLTVTGFGFNSENIEATVDGEPCTVTSYSETSFSCKVGSKDAASETNVARSGNNGVTNDKYDFLDYYGYWTWVEPTVMYNDDFEPYERKLEM
jgi:hypothetical protein